MRLTTTTRIQVEEEVVARRRTLGSDHVDTLHAMSLMAKLDFATGDRAAAELVARQCYQRYKKTLGAEDPRTL